MKRFYQKYQDAFSLIEIALALAVIGIMITGILKGKHLIDQARLQRLVQDIQSYQTAVTQFYEQYQGIPGDYAQASSHIKAGLTNGNGNGIIEGDEAAQAWAHLQAAGLLNSESTPTFLGGGRIVFVTNPGGNQGTYLQLSRGPNGALKPKQVKFLVDQLGSSAVIVANDAGSNPSCLNGDNQLQLHHDSPACIVYIDLNI